MGGVYVSSPLSITVSIEKELGVSVSSTQDVTIAEIEQLLKYFLQLPSDIRQRYVCMVAGSVMAAYPGQETNDRIVSDLFEKK